VLYFDTLADFHSFSLSLNPDEMVQLLTQPRFKVSFAGISERRYVLKCSLYHFLTSLLYSPCQSVNFALVKHHVPYLKGRFLMTRTILC